MLNETNGEEVLARPRAWLKWLIERSLPADQARTAPLDRSSDMLLPRRKERAVSGNDGPLQIGARWKGGGTGAVG